MRLARSLALHLVQEATSFVNLLDELGIVAQIVLSLLERKVDQHACNLRSQVLALQLGDEVKDSVSDLLLKVRVLSLH